MFERQSKEGAARRSMLIVSILLLIGILCTSLFFLVSLSNQRLVALTQQHIHVWQQISRNTSYIINYANRQDSSVSALNFAKKNLAELLLTEASLNKRINKRLPQARLQRRILLQDITGFGDTEVDAAFRKQIQKVADAPVSVLRAGFSMWDTATVVKFRSNSVSKPLFKNAESIAAMQERATRTIWFLFALVSVAVMAGVWAVWAHILEPGIVAIQLASDEKDQEMRVRQQAQLALENREVELSLILDQIPGLVARYDRDGRFLSINQAYRAAFNLPADCEIKGRYIRDVIGEQCWQQIEPFIKQVISGEEFSFETRMPFPTGSRFVQARYVPGLVKDGVAEQFIALIVDMEDRYQMEQDLRYSENNLRITLQSIGDAVIATDNESNIIRMNPVAEQLTGWSIVEAQGKPLEAVFKVVNGETYQPIENPVDKVIESKMIVGLANNAVLISRDGQEHMIADSGAPILDEEGVINGVVMVFRDVTDEYRLQEKVTQSDKLTAIGQLAGGIAHDFNNMLAGIMGSAEVISLVEKDNLQEGTNRHLAAIINTTKRAADLTDKLTAFAGNRRLVTTHVDMHFMVQEVVDLVMRTIDRKVLIHVNQTADSPVIFGNVGTLQSALLNICINATQAMPNGGTINIETDNVNLSDIDIEVSSFQLVPGQYLRIRCSDTGSGISPSGLTRIFDPFYTTKAKGEGTGLGLSAVFGTVVEHGGAVEVESEEGRGSTFTLLFPTTDEQPNTGDKLDITAIAGSGLVLFVDDEKLLLDVGELMLRKLGLDVLTARNGQEAVDIYKKWHNNIDVVVMDLNMPVMGGLAAIEEIKSINPTCDVIISSGYTDAKMREKADAMGVSKTLGKPYRYADLRGLLGDLIT